MTIFQTYTKPDITTKKSLRENGNFPCSLKPPVAKDGYLFFTPTSGEGEVDHYSLGEKRGGYAVRHQLNT
jgi:hypothetical protein